MRASRWLRRIESLDPDTDFAEMYRLHSQYEFPWDTVQSLSFALFRTFAVPSIGALLHRTGEFTGRVQKRYDDTALLLDAVNVCGFASVEGREALRRINAMHRAYDISDDDYRYVLATFVVVPVRWLADFGWRPLTAAERTAMTNYYRELGRHMAIKDIPADYAGFERLLDAYEATHFGFDPGSRAVADATLDLMTTFAPFRFLPRAVSLRVARALMDDALLDAFCYPHPARAERWLARSGLRARARFVRLLPPRRSANATAQMSNIRSYPEGYRVADLGTSPCPVRSADPAASHQPG